MQSDNVITDAPALAAYCESLDGVPWVTVDTEFMREKTYWPKLCLVQISGPESGSERAIDPLAPGIDLAPLFRIFADPKIVKIFHAARQDVEIAYKMMGSVPTPLFDTQVAAMVCGYGDQIGYEALVQQILRKDLDKSSRFTDWSHRPLTARQIHYALSDVTHLRDIYRHLSSQLEETGRSHWLGEEMAILTAEDTYRADPEMAWKRLKLRNGKPLFLQAVREMAAWREVEAQARDIPRNRIMKDESLLDVAGSMPSTLDELARIRGLGRGFADGRLGRSVLEAVARAKAVPKEDLPQQKKTQRPPPGVGPMTDLLKVLLKRNSENAGVASRLIATSDDLEKIAGDDSANVAALRGWRRELFGEDALALKRGEIALTGGAHTSIDIIRREA